MALAYRIHLDDAEARRIVDAWRAANPWAPEFWGAHRYDESYGLWGAAMQAWELPGQITTAVFAATGSLWYALLYPILVPAVCFVLALFLMPETRHMSIWEEAGGKARAIA